MKLIYGTDRKAKRIYTIQDLAEAIGVVRLTVTNRITATTLPPPDVTLNKRRFYSELEFVRLVSENKR